MRDSIDDQQQHRDTLRDDRRDDGRTHDHARDGEHVLPQSPLPTRDGVDAARDHGMSTAPATRGGTVDGARHAAHDVGTGNLAGDGVRSEVSPVKGAAAGAAAGTMAGLQAGALGGALLLGVGGLAGAALGAAAGASLATTVQPTGFDAAADEHYRALYEGGVPVADRRYDDMRAAYAFGHLAAQEPSLAGRTFAEVEPELRAAWNDELSRRAGPWDSAQRMVRDAYGHARSEGAGARRNLAVPGSAGSAVDPVELERAQRGETSDGRPLVGDGAVDGATPGTPPGAQYGERPPLGANEAHRRDAELH